jgi:hypothetical protein
MGVHVSEVMVPVPAMKFGKEMGMHFLSPDVFRYCKIYLDTIEVKFLEQFNFREPLKTHEKPSSTTEAQRKSKAKKPEIPSAFLAFLCASMFPWLMVFGFHGLR